MAIAAADIPITRDNVMAWLAEFKQQKKSKTELAAFLVKKVQSLHLPDAVVDTTEHESLKNSTSVIDLIMDDLKSYGY